MLKHALEGIKQNYLGGCYNTVDASFNMKWLKPTKEATALLSLQTQITKLQSLHTG